MKSLRVIFFLACLVSGYCLIYSAEPVVAAATSLEVPNIANEGFRISGGRNKVLIAALFRLEGIAAILATDSQETQKAATPFSVQKLAEGVFAVIRKERPGLEFDGNVVFIINDNDVIVVDANVTPTSAKETLVALRKLTNKPVKYVVNTHWHDDHIIGNQVWREAFPDVEFIAQSSTLMDLPTVGASNRKQLLDNGARYFAFMRSQVEKNKSLNGKDLTPEERESYLRDAEWGDRYLSEIPKTPVILPTLTVDSQLTLYRGNRIIEIKHLGRAHTAADLVVHLPKEGIVITGDIVVWPVPLVGSTSYPIDYSATLDKLLAIHAPMIVPGHGPVMRDDAYVRLMARLLASIKQQVEAAVARGETLEQTRKSVKLNEFRNAITGDSQLKRILFDDYVTGPGIAGAYRQATEKR